MELKIVDMSSGQNESLFTNLDSRQKMDLTEVNETVDRILDQVQQQGDEALYALTQRYDRVDLSGENFKIPAEQLAAAAASIDSDLRAASETAAANIRRFHAKQLEGEAEMELDDGRGRRTALLSRPLDTVGIYVPGGSAPLPSSVLMNAIPAKVAGVRRLIMATPPQADGTVADVILAAAAIAGVDAVYRVGGAQAIAAMAYGTEQIPAVDKLVGPGNIYVNVAKQKVFGTVDIDLFAGPSEILIIAADDADPLFVAADLMSQAEHDKLSSAILICSSRDLAEQVRACVTRLLDGHPRRAIVEASLDRYGAILLVDSLDGAISLANRIAPEHLELSMDATLARTLIPQIRNAGAVFIGPYSPEPLGDYWAGSNHVLPTSGTARFFSPLSTRDFMKRMTVIQYDETALLEDAEQIIRLAEAEGLASHAYSIRARVDKSREVR